MRIKSLLTTFVCLCFNFSVWANEGSVLFLPKALKASFDSLSINTKGTPFFLIHVNYNDCINCNLGLNLFIKDPSFREDRCIFSFTGVPKTKIPILLKQLGLSTKTKLLETTAISEYLNDQFTVPGIRSVIIKYSGYDWFEYFHLKYLGQPSIKKYLFTSEQGFSAPLAIKNDSFFYTGFSHVVMFGQNLLACTSPQGQLLSINKKGIIERKAEVDSAFLAKHIFPIFIESYPDSIKKLNPVDSVMKSYEVNIKPSLGMEQVAFNCFDVRDGFLYASCYIYFPLLLTPTKISYDGRGFIFKYDTLLNLVEHFQYHFETFPRTAPIIDYGFRVEKDGSALYIATLDYNLKLNEKNYLRGKWTKKEAFHYVCEEIDTTRFTSQQIQDYFYQRHKELTFKYHYLNDTIVYFDYVPILYNLSTRKIVESYPHQLLKDEKLSKERLGFKTLFATLGQSNQVYGVDYIKDRHFFTLREVETGKILFIMPMPKKIKGAPRFCADNSTLYMITQDDDLGTIIQKTPLNKLFPL